MGDQMLSWLGFSPLGFGSKPCSNATTALPGGAGGRVYGRGFPIPQMVADGRM
jgi:hypothetical protein